MPVYAATIFLSALFGGSAAVLFFQLLLLAGYLYAHRLIRSLKPKQQLWTHAPLLILSLATLPILPSVTWKPGRH